ncbi:MAG: hypothetical protein LBE65_06445 [Synergistaceae bacterium]|jgi:hypothetical protein|nr:hypothetical protein [Synergistaceae bacterium]
MNVSSVSSYSDTLWEEYLERLRKKQQQKESPPISETAGAAASAVSSVPAPDEILSELQELQGDPEQLKARASELAAQVAEEAENSAGVRANALNELASDLEEVADSGDLSVLQEKLAGKSGAARPQGPPPGGMGGASGVSSKLMEALIEEEDDENSSGIDDIKAFLEKIQELAEEEKSKISDAQFSSELTPEKILAELETLRDDPERLKARASELAGQLKGDTGLRAEAALPLVADLEEIAESGDLSKLREKASRTSPGTIKPGNEYASLGLESLVSKFQALKEMSASNTPDAAGDSDETEGAAAKNQTSANDLISKIKAGLSDRFIAIYAQRQIPVSTVSLSG